MQMVGNGGVIVAGPAAKDAEYKVVGQKGTPKCTFGVIVGRDEQDKPIFANVEAWRALAEYAAGITKGTPVMVMGRIEEHEYEGKKYKNMVADYLMYLDLTARPATEAPPAMGGFTQVPNDGDLPF